MAGGSSCTKWNIYFSSSKVYGIGGQKPRDPCTEMCQLCFRPIMDSHLKERKNIQKNLDARKLQIKPSHDARLAV